MQCWFYLCMDLCQLVNESFHMLGPFDTSNFRRVECNSNNRQSYSLSISIYFLNCIRRDGNSTYKTDLRVILYKTGVSVYFTTFTRLQLLLIYTGKSVKLSLMGFIERFLKSYHSVLQKCRNGYLRQWKMA